MKYIKRLIEKEIKNSFETYKAVLVTGARQVGKTKMLKEVFPNLKYIDLDDIFMEAKAKEDGTLFLENNKYPLIIDEVQRVPELFQGIKYKCDENEEYGKYILSGSQLFRLMEKASDSLAGRVHIIELANLSLREIQGIEFYDKFIPTEEYIQNRKKFVKPIDDIWTIIHKGSYPELYSSNKEWEWFYADYVKTYIERDVRELINIRYKIDFEKFLSCIAARTGQVLNYSNIASDVGVDVKTIISWVGILETSNLVYLLQPFANSNLKRSIKSPKIYFRDTGLVAYLTRWLTKDTLMNGAMAGNIFETFVVSEILKSFSNNGVEYRHYMYYYNGYDNSKHTQSEIDFIIDVNGKLYPIEIKMSANPNKGMANNFCLLEKATNKELSDGAIICMTKEAYKLDNKLYAIPVNYL